MPRSTRRWRRCLHRNTIAPPVLWSADPTLVKEAAALLTAAELPAVYVGGGVRHSGLGRGAAIGGAPRLSRPARLFGAGACA